MSPTGSPERLASVDEVHTAAGAHRTVEVAFPDWIPAEDLAAAALLTADEALALLPGCLRERWTVRGPGENIRGARLLALSATPVQAAPPDIAEAGAVRQRRDYRRCER